jgi:hypothetical protein
MNTPCRSWGLAGSASTTGSASRSMPASSSFPRASASRSRTSFPDLKKIIEKLDYPISKLF